MVVVIVVVDEVVVVVVAVVVELEEDLEGEILLHILLTKLCSYQIE